jgi:uncharacterized protein DUF3105
MANRKKRRSRQPRPSGRTPPRAPNRPARSTAERNPGGADLARRERKEQVRLAREAARRRIRRRDAFRRALVGGTVGVVAVGVFYFLQRAAAPTPLPDSALAAARSAGCDPNVVTPASDAPGGLHLESGQPYDYDQDPPTSGYHDAPLPDDPRVYQTALPETHAVHTLEHAAVIVYYRAEGTDALPSDVVDRLAAIVQSSRNGFLAPYPTLPEGTSLAFTAWNKLLSCPGTITADQAATLANGFIHSFECTGNAPEPKASGNC